MKDYLETSFPLDEKKLSLAGENNGFSEIKRKKWFPLARKSVSH